MKKTSHLIASLVLGVPLLLSASKSLPDTRGTEAPPTLCRKSGAPVALKYKLLKIDPGESAETEVMLENDGPSGSLTLSVASDPGLQVEFTGSTKLSVDAGGTIPLKLRVTGVQEGRHYLRLRAVWEDGRIRSFALPVQVGSGAPKLLKSVVRRGPDGEKISVFKAAEQIEK